MSCSQGLMSKKGSLDSTFPIEIFDFDRFAISKTVDFKQYLKHDYHIFNLKITVILVVFQNVHFNAEPLVMLCSIGLHVN